MSLITLNNIGDVGILNFNFVEQVVSVDSFSDNITGETATRTVTKEFRWGTDGSTWSSWLALTDAMLSALSLNANNRFYIQARYTRGGSDASGQIQINQLLFNYTFDPQATQGHGALVNTLLDDEMPDLMVAMIENYLYQVGGGDHYDVRYTHPLACNPSTKPIIYVYNFDTADTVQASLCEWRQVVRFVVGVKRVIDRTKGYGWQLGRLRSMFNPHVSEQFTFNFTFKTVDFVAVTMRDMGIMNPEASGMVEYFDQDCDAITHEFAVSMEVRFKSQHHESV
ncbi:MAG: hypothetical protein GWN62_16875 [Aliifodinibius sp.]|nr:hypothetical protein [Fodinibius sp.]